MKLTKIFIGIVIISVVIAPILIACNYGILPTITEFWLQYVTLLLSTTSFLAVIYTIIQQNNSNKKHDEEIAKEFEFAKQNYDAQILNIIERFGSDDMIRCRQSSDMLFSSLSNDVDLKYLKTILKCEIYGYKGVEEDLKLAIDTTMYRYYADFLQVTRLFYVLSCYEYDEVTCNAIKYEYDYYRRIFVAVNRIYWETIVELPSDRIYDSFNCFKTQWYSILETFDNILINGGYNRYNINQYSYDLYCKIQSRSI